MFNANVLEVWIRIMSSFIRAASLESLGDHTVQHMGIFELGFYLAKLLSYTVRNIHSEKLLNDEGDMETE